MAFKPEQPEQQQQQKEQPQRQQQQEEQQQQQLEQQQPPQPPSPPQHLAPWFIQTEDGRVVQGPRPVGPRRAAARQQQLERWQQEEEEEEQRARAPGDELLGLGRRREELSQEIHTRRRDVVERLQQPLPPRPQQQQQQQQAGAVIVSRAGLTAEQKREANWQNRQNKRLKRGMGAQKGLTTDSGRVSKPGQGRRQRGAQLGREPAAKSSISGSGFSSGSLGGRGGDGGRRGHSSRHNLSPGRAREEEEDVRCLRCGARSEGQRVVASAEHVRLLPRWCSVCGRPRLAPVSDAGGERNPLL